MKKKRVTPGRRKAESVAVPSRGKARVAYGGTPSSTRARSPIHPRREAPRVPKGEPEPDPDDSPPTDLDD